MSDEPEYLRSRKGKWNHDICSCGHVPMKTFCVSGCFCSCCQLTKLHSYTLGEKPPQCCSVLPCLFLTLGVWWGGIPTMIQHCVVRQQIANQLGIPEDNCTTCFMAACCTCSSTVQMTMTVANQTSDPGGSIYLFMSEEDQNPLLSPSEQEPY